MPNARRPGWVVRSYAVDLEVYRAAQARAAAQGTTVSAVVRTALEAFVAGGK